MTIAVDLTLAKGTDFSHVFNFTTGGQPSDLTGYDARMQLRGSASDVAASVELTRANGRLLLDEENGEVTLALSASETGAITLTGAALYDLELISPTGVVTRPVKGAVTLEEEITR